MPKSIYTIAEIIRDLREQKGMTQSELAKTLGITRSGVNAWEMGLSTPSTQYIAQLAKTFGVSSDYLLGLDDTATVSVKGLTKKQVAVVVAVIDCFNDTEEQFKL